MALEAGTRLGHYEVVSSLGAGGMGEVYRAGTRRLVGMWRSSCCPRKFVVDEELKTLENVPGGGRISYVGSFYFRSRCAKKAGPLTTTRSPGRSRILFGRQALEGLSDGT